MVQRALWELFDGIGYPNRRYKEPSGNFVRTFKTQNYWYKRHFGDLKITLTNLDRQYSINKELKIGIRN